MSHHIEDLIHLFEQTFFARFNTRLVKGGDEPIYIPANSQCRYHQIIFAHGFYTSGLHEIAHWCIAGEARRLQEDYGYWYAPDGRDQQQQAVFEAVEVKPQAIEWALSLAAGIHFNVSVDNLNGFQPDRHQFQDKVAEQALRYQLTGFPPRAQQFIDCLRAFYGTPDFDFSLLFTNQCEELV